jgi:hypothetical protein
MKAYFLNIPNEERNNILDQHKSIYNGYQTSYGTNAEQPLFVQDLANDKGGITVNNKGEVKKYTHMKINEEIDEMELDMIGDGPMDLEAGVMDDEMTEGMFEYSGYGAGDENYMLKYHLGALKKLLHQAKIDETPEEELDWLYNRIEKLENQIANANSDEEISEGKPEYKLRVDFHDELGGDEEMNESVKSQVNESLNWFKRFSKYN